MTTTGTVSKEREMDKDLKVDEVDRLEAVNRELCQKLVDLEVEVDRKNKTVEGFMAENEALKAELGSRRGFTKESSSGAKIAARIDRWKNSVGGTRK
jgi:cell shape-determining protein MreC